MRADISASSVSLLLHAHNTNGANVYVPIPRSGRSGSDRGVELTFFLHRKNGEGCACTGRTAVIISSTEKLQRRFALHAASGAPSFSSHPLRSPQRNLCASFTAQIGFIRFQTGGGWHFTKLCALGFCPSCRVVTLLLFGFLPHTLRPIPDNASITVYIVIRHCKSV